MQHESTEASIRYGNVCLIDLDSDLIEMTDSLAALNSNKFVLYPGQNKPTKPHFYPGYPRNNVGPYSKALSCGKVLIPDPEEYLRVCY